MNWGYEEFLCMLCLSKDWDGPSLLIAFHNCLFEVTAPGDLDSPHTVYFKTRTVFYLLSFLPPGHKGDIPFVVISFGCIVPIGQFDQVRKVCFEPIVVEHCLHNSEKALVSNLFSSIKRAQVRATDEPEIVLKGQLSRFSNNTFFPLCAIPWLKGQKSLFVWPMYLVLSFKFWFWHIFVNYLELMSLYAIP